MKHEHPVVQLGTGHPCPYVIIPVNTEPRALGLAATRAHQGLTSRQIPRLARLRLVLTGRVRDRSSSFLSLSLCLLPSLQRERESKREEESHRENEKTKARVNLCLYSGLGCVEIYLWKVYREGQRESLFSPLRHRGNGQQKAADALLRGGLCVCMWAQKKRRSKSGASGRSIGPVG